MSLINIGTELNSKMIKQGKMLGELRNKGRKLQWVMIMKAVKVTKTLMARQLSLLIHGMEAVKNHQVKKSMKSDLMTNKVF